MLRPVRLAMAAMLALLAGRQRSPSILTIADGLAPNENLVADGVPPIPVESRGESRAATVITAGRRSLDLSLRTARKCSWPDALRVTRIRSMSLRQAGGARKQLTFFPDRVEGAQSPSPTTGNISSFCTKA